MLPFAVAAGDIGVEFCYQLPEGFAGLKEILITGNKISLHRTYKLGDRGIGMSVVQYVIAGFCIYHAVVKLFVHKSPCGVQMFFFLCKGIGVKKYVVHSAIFYIEYLTVGLFVPF